MQLPKTFNTKSGSLLVELSIAVAITSISIMAIASVLFARQSYILDVHLRRSALFSAVSNLENARALLDKNYLSNISTTSVDGLITSSVSMQDETACFKTVSAQSSWQTRNIQKSISFSILIPFLDYAKSVDGDCGGTSTTSLSIPKIFSTTFTASSTALDVFNNKIFVSSVSGSTSTISIFEKSISSTINVMSSMKIPGIITSLDATKTHLYLGLQGTTSPLKTLNIQDSTKPKLIAENTLPGVAGSFPGATSIFYYNNKLYVGAHRTAGNEFHIFDVKTGSPVWLGSIELNHNINAISVREPYAFLATSGNTQNLIILDISNPKSIKKISNVAFTGTEDSLSEFLIGNTLYIGRKKSLKPIDPDFIAIDVTDPTQPTIIGTTTLQKDITGVRIAGKYAFLASNGSPNALTVLDISNLQKIQLVNTFSVNEQVQDLDIENASAFLLIDSKITEYDFK